MSKKRKRPDPPFWTTGPDSGKSKSGKPLPFVQIFADLAQADAFNRLSYAARWVYVCACLEAKGQRNFCFSRTTAARYGIPENTLRRALSELQSAGFIRCIVHGKPTRSPNVFSFVFDWKNPNEST